MKKVKKIQQANQNEKVVSPIEKKRFTTKDLVALGILNAVIIVFTAVIVIVFSCTPPIIMMFSDVVVSLFIGVIYMFMVAKIPKFGIFTLTGIIIGSIFLLISGIFLTLVGSVCGGILGDLIALKWGRYKSKGGIFTAYVLSRIGFVIGRLISYFLWSDIMIEQGISIGYSREYMETVLSCFTIEMFSFTYRFKHYSSISGSMCWIPYFEKTFCKG